MSENYENWQQGQRVSQDHWDSATSSGQYAPTPSQSHDWSSPAPSGSYGGSGGGGYRGGYAGSFGRGGPTFLSIIPWIPALPVLYPLPFVVAFLGAGLGYGVLEAQFEVYSASGRDGLAAGAFVIGAVLFIATIRLDHRLAASGVWRIPRHVLRLGLVTIVAHAAAASLLHAPGQLAEDAILDVALLQNPVYLASLGAAAILAHIVLTRPRLREWWHARLKAAWLERAG